MRKGNETYHSNAIFGDEDLIDNKGRYKYTTIAKTHCWILKIKKSVFKNEIKESIRKIKEAKAVFIFNSFPQYTKSMSYTRFKDFIMRYFKPEKILMNSLVIEQGCPSDSLMIVKQGLFALIKGVKTIQGYYKRVNSYDKEIFLILGPNSIIGEDGYLFDTNYSYSVKAITSDAMVYKIDTDRFAKKMGPFRKQFMKLLEQRFETIKQKTDKLIDTKYLTQSIAGPKP